MTSEEIKRLLRDHLIELEKEYFQLKQDLSNINLDKGLVYEKVGTNQDQRELLHKILAKIEDPKTAVRYAYNK